ncbi:phosphoglycerate mutase family protein [Draconibacterium halophilum]|uniref:Phosphoglycerate mutase family protein n=1 Tax=Draconibacterium halophilum TaxID=2706887 RepID=A0A6C0R8Y9_9BACT|nr:phosphoglycerate mutase family protein [Draconibacterium halophilum]QIA06948.1 phosphoglycerate mutase family protein [Draconibacterium halophilum]
MKTLTQLIFFLVIILGGQQSLAQEVILIRHAAVKLDRHGWMGAKTASAMRDAYDTAPIRQFNPDTVLSKIPERITDTIYVSGLSRSIATGLKLFGDSATIVSLKDLNEFEMHMVWLPLFLPYKVWTSLSRTMWLMGLKRPGTESFQEARDRVDNVSSFIERKAEQNKQAILVTHGFINRNIAIELEKRGWHIIQNNGRKNLGATVLRK